MMSSAMIGTRGGSKPTTPSEYLSVDELRSLTGYTRANAQSLWLRERGVPQRQDGRRVIVSRVHVLAWLEGRNIVIGVVNFAAMR